MKAMILAAGKGTRIRPLTNIMPKPMIPLLSKPVMESIIEHLYRYNFREIIVNTSYLSNSIESYFRDGSPWGVEIAYSYEGYLENDQFIDKPLGSAGGMKKIQQFSGFFDDTFIVVCGDALIDVNFHEVIAFHKSRKSIATLVMKEVSPSEVNKYGIVVTDAQGQVVQFQEKPSMEEALSTSANTGIYVFEPEIFNYIPDNVEFDIGSQLFPALVSHQVPFYGIALPFQWVDIGSVPDFWIANRLLLTKEVGGHKIPGKEVKPGIWCGINVKIDFDKVNIHGPVYIGSSTEIQDDVTIIGPTFIGANCLIESGANITEGLITDYTRIGHQATIEQHIVFAGKVISPNGTTIDLHEAGLDWLIDDRRRQTLQNEENALLNELIYHANQ